MIPTPLYETMPYLYGALGFIAALGLDPTGGRACGLVLVAVSMHVLRLRRRYRKGF